MNRASESSKSSKEVVEEEAEQSDVTIVTKRRRRASSKEGGVLEPVREIIFNHCIKNYYFRHFFMHTWLFAHGIYILAGDNVLRRDGENNISQGHATKRRRQWTGAGFLPLRLAPNGTGVNETVEFGLFLSF